MRSNEVPPAFHEAVEQRVRSQWGLVSTGVDALAHVDMMLASHYGRTREDAIGILGQIGGVGVGEEYLERSIRHEADQIARHAAIIAAGQIKARCTLDALSIALKTEDDQEMQEDAAKAILRILGRPRGKREFVIQAARQ